MSNCPLFFSCPGSSSDLSSQVTTTDKLVKLPPHLAQQIWQGSALGKVTTKVIPTGYPQLDNCLPGGGWACQNVTEILQDLAGLAEWRLLTPALARVSAATHPVVLIGCPHEPYSPGLQQASLPPHHLVWVQAQTMAQRLWVAEQAIQSRGPSAVLVWLPHARSEHIRRLQAQAQGRETLIFTMRPSTVQFEASAAPLRLALSVAGPWNIGIQILKRRGTRLDTPLILRALPGRLSTVPLAQRMPAYQEQNHVASTLLAGTLARQAHV